MDRAEKRVDAGGGVFKAHDPGGFPRYERGSAKPSRALQIGKRVGGKEILLEDDGVAGSITGNEANHVAGPRADCVGNELLRSGWAPADTHGMNLRTRRQLDGATIVQLQLGWSIRHHLVACE